MVEMSERSALATAAVQEAERRRLEALETIASDPMRYAELAGKPSTWCVVTQRGFWSRKYHDRLEESRLRDCIERGHKVILTLGLVAQADSPLTVNNHVASIVVNGPRKLSADKLSMITVRAKLHAAHSLGK